MLLKVFLAGGKSATCSISINPATIPVTKLTLDRTSAGMKVGNSLQLDATIEPSNATDQKIIWTSSDPDIASVTYSGLVTAHKAGTVTITASCGGQSATCFITVSEKDVAVTGITLNKTSADMYVGGRIQLIAAVEPSNATNQNIQWSTTSTSLVRLYPGEFVEALQKGTVTILPGARQILITAVWIL